MLKNGWLRTGRRPYMDSSRRPTIEVVDGRHCHEFKCAAPHCKGKGTKTQIVRCYLDKGDKGSTSNMHKHVNDCWGEEIVSKALETKTNLL
jgi:hypothetical protein